MHVLLLTFTCVSINILTGGLGIDSRDVANKTLHVIGDFFQKCRPQNLKLIRITIFQQQIVGVFQQAMTDLIAMPQSQDDRNRVSKFFGRLTKYTSSLFAISVQGCEKYPHQSDCGDN